ncbi:MAG: PBECR4 domain-containing protein [Clostridium sp.]|nr:PBECR4 domain-containing protein [Clostridium sp.]
MYREIKELDEILDDYENELCRRIFRYQLNDKINIEIMFYKENFCHLLGIQHIYGKNKRYLGINGYNEIKSGKLKRSNDKSKYQYISGQECKRITNFEIIELDK